MYKTFLLFPRRLASGQWAWLQTVWCDEIVWNLGYDGCIVDKVYYAASPKKENKHEK